MTTRKMGAAAIAHLSQDATMCGADDNRAQLALEDVVALQAELERMKAAAANEVVRSMKIAAERDALRAVLTGCADALHEAAKSFALNNPKAARPNLFDLHESAARGALDPTRPVRRQQPEDPELVRMRVE